MFSCPNCAQVLGEYPDAGVVVIPCARCSFKYEVSGGRVIDLTSWKVEVRPATLQTRAMHARCFELALTISARESLRFTFATERDDDWIRMRPGAMAVVVYSMRGEKREELLFVVDRTSGERYVLAKPGHGSRERAVVYGSLAGMVAAVVGAMTFPLIAALGIGAMVGAGTFKGLGYVLKPNHALPADEREALVSRQALLGQKRELQRSRDAVMIEIDGRRALSRQLGSLRARMVTLNVDAYADRIAAIDRALTTLDAQLDVDMRLATEYERTIQVLDIEYESGIAAEALPDDSASILDARLLELHGVEELRAETTRRLAANAEVERLLRTPTR
ncbi:MAG: hypothetical protein M3Z05_00785 [Gemmatimonadota bacterium]|nr:hypothetical protein [Gemmatimonadota bacterium]